MSGKRAKIIRRIAAGYWRVKVIREGLMAYYGRRGYGGGPRDPYGCWVSDLMREWKRRGSLRRILDSVREGAGIGPG